MSEDLYTDPQWLVFFPTNRYEAMFNDLYRIYANRCYFIRVEATKSITWSIWGRPAVPRPDWKPNEYNLMGLPFWEKFASMKAGPLKDSGISLAEFFEPDAALDGQDVYRLDEDGVWQLVEDPSEEEMRSGEALWVWAAAETDYMGPVKVSVEMGDGLEYGTIRDEASIFIENLSPSYTEVYVWDVSEEENPIEYWSLDDDEGGVHVEWRPIYYDGLYLVLEPGETHTVRLAVRREEFEDDILETTIEVLSDLGTRVRIPLSAESTGEIYDP